MIDSPRKQQLEDSFFQDTLPQDNLTQEDMEYIEVLSNKWNSALRNLYGQIMDADRLSKNIMK